MTELTTGQLIKIILGILVVAVVVVGIYFFFKDYFIEFFKNMAGGGEIFLGLIC